MPISAREFLALYCAINARLSWRIVLLMYSISGVGKLAAHAIRLVLGIPDEGSGQSCRSISPGQSSTADQDQGDPQNQVRGLLDLLGTVMDQWPVTAAVAEWLWAAEAGLEWRESATLAAYLTEMEQLAGEAA